MPNYIKPTTFIERVENALPPERSLSELDYMTFCPAHNDTETPNLHITFTPDGETLTHCFAGCKRDAVLKGIESKTGLTAYDMRANPEDGTSLELFSTLRGIPVTFLREQGLSNRNSNPDYPPSIEIPYMSEDGTVTAYRYRNHEGKARKDSRPKQSMRKGDVLTPYNLMHLNKIREYGYVYLVEGESDALTGLYKGIPTVGIPGANNFKEGFEGYFEGLQVFVIAEPDHGGRKFAETVTNRIPDARVIQLPGVKDLSEAYSKGLLTPANKAQWERDSKLFGDVVWGYSGSAGVNSEFFRGYSGSEKADNHADFGGYSGYSGYSGEETEKVPVFPTEVLPEPSRTYVEEGANAIGVPPEMVGIPFIVSSAAAIGNTRSIELKKDYTQPSVVFAGIISPPGTAKSPAMAFAQKPLNTLQREAYAKHTNEMIAHEEAIQAAKKKKGTPLPTPPVAELIYTTDSTVEGIAEALKTSTGILNYRDELSGFIGSMDAYRGGKGGDRDTYLSLWNGYDLHIHRKNSGTTYITDPSVSVFGGIQPDRVSSLADAKGKHDGFIDRWLLARPVTGSRRWNERSGNPETLNQVTNVVRRLRYPIGFEGSVALPLSDDAREVFAEWYDENAGLVESSNGLAAGFYSKYPNQLGRLILILHLLQHPDDLTGPIHVNTVRDGITLIEYFRASLIRILPMFKAEASKESVGILPRVRRLLEKAEGKWIDRTALNRGLGGYEKSESITTALETLQRQGIAESQSLPPGPTGGRPKEQWRFVVSPDSMPEKPEKPDKPQKAYNGADSSPGKSPDKPRNNSGITPDKPSNASRGPTPFGTPRGSIRGFQPVPPVESHDNESKSRND